MGKVAFNERHLSRTERREKRDAVIVEFDQGSERDARAWEDGFMETAAIRPTFKPLNDAATQALDALLNSYAVRDLLGSLALLCEARAPSEFDLDTDFSDHDESERWQANANALFSVMGNLK
jgi:hypothetical protein